MIKLILFDLDGVLVDSRELHYVALNEALAEVGLQYVINREEHLGKYDGLTTTRKLQRLTDEKGLPQGFHEMIWKSKQQKTKLAIESVYQRDDEKCIMMSCLASAGYKIAVVSNAIHETVREILFQTGLAKYVDRFYSNEDVRKPKPASEIYLKAMMDFGVSPKETVIIEDSHIGRQGALGSGGHLLAVKNPAEVTYFRIIDFITSLQTNKQPKWQGGKMNVLIPMAGAGSRFEKAGYTFPKPLIEIYGKPMIQLVVENLNIHAKHIFIVQKSHYEKYNLKQLLNLIAPNCEIVQVEGITEGAACTTLLAKQYIDNDEALIIANSDQYIEWNSNEFMYSMVGDTIDGGILTFTATHPKWSFAKTNEDGFVTEVAEKNPISNQATVGVYYWAKGSDYVKYAERMIERNVRVNNEFYVCPVYNQAIEDGQKIKTYHINRMWGVGTPEDLQTFLQENKETV